MHGSMPRAAPRPWSTVPTHRIDSTTSIVWHIGSAHLRIVSDAEFEASIAEIEADVVRQARADAAASSTDGSLDEDSVKRIALARGVFGPGSITWRVGRESVIFLAGLRAALMQLARPYVAIGVRHHSHIASGIQRRFYRTFKVRLRCCCHERADAD